MLDVVEIAERVLAILELVREHLHFANDHLSLGEEAEEVGVGARGELLRELLVHVAREVLRHVVHYRLGYHLRHAPAHHLVVRLHQALHLSAFAARVRRDRLQRQRALRREAHRQRRPGALRRPCRVRHRRRQRCSERALSGVGARHTLCRRTARL